MPRAAIAKRNPTYKKGPPKYMVKIKSADKLSDYANTIIKRIIRAAECQVPIAVKTYCCNEDVAQFWAGIWCRFGFKPEMLLTSTVYFEAQPKELAEIALRLPAREVQFVFVDRMSLAPSAGPVTDEEEGAAPTG